MRGSPDRFGYRINLIKYQYAFFWVNGLFKFSTKWDWKIIHVGNVKSSSISSAFKCACTPAKVELNHDKISLLQCISASWVSAFPSVLCRDLTSQLFSSVIISFPSFSKKHTFSIHYSPLSGIRWMSVVVKYMLWSCVILESLVCVLGSWVGLTLLAAASLLYSSDDLPRLPSAAPIVGNIAFWCRP